MSILLVGQDLYTTVQTSNSQCTAGIYLKNYENQNFQRHFQVVDKNLNPKIWIGSDCVIGIPDSGQHEKR